MASFLFNFIPHEFFFWFISSKSFNLPLSALQLSAVVGTECICYTSFYNVTITFFFPLSPLSSQHIHELPLVLIFGIATSPMIIHRLLPHSVSSLLCIELFQSLSCKEHLSTIIDKVTPFLNRNEECVCIETQFTWVAFRCRFV